MMNLTRKEQLAKLQARYASRGRRGKSRMLDEICEQYGYDRKYAIKLLAGWKSFGVGAHRPGPPCRYEPIREVAVRIWQQGEKMCGKRLVAALPLWLPAYEEHFGRLLPTQRMLLEEVSAATLDRLLAPARAKASRGRSGTKPGTLLREQIPIQGEAWNETEPGFLEADSVAHCGDSLSGEFLGSLVYTDLCSTWTAARAVWGKGSTAVLAQTREVEAALPFLLRGFDCDNGSEWLNWHLLRYFQERTAPVRVTRSRPYHKDDNAHVEQKNWMWPRQLLGYGRLDRPEVVPLVNALYKEAWEPLHNFFLPSMKLREKWREGSRWVRRHDPAQTACQRLLNHPHVSAKTKRTLREQAQALDPFTLARDVEQRLVAILRPQPAAHQRRVS